MAVSEPLLEVRGLTTVFNSRRGLVRAVDGASLSLRQGRVLGLVGESGSGKSTLALSIMRLLGPTGRIVGGGIRFRGEDLLGKSAGEMRVIRGSRIAMVFQDPYTSLTPSMSVGAQIVEAIRAHEPVSSGSAFERAIELLEQVGIAHPRQRAAEFPHQFSGGMRQRVAVAIALSCSPELLILDEPTTALDVTIQAAILDLLADLRRKFGLAMIFITHHLGVVMRVSDDVCVMYAGRVVEHTAMEELFERPRHPYTKGLLASVPALSGASARQRLSSIPGELPDAVALPRGCIFQARCPWCEQTCRDQPQPLIPLSSSSATACWKYNTVAALGWPAEAAASTPVALVDTPMTKSVVEVQDIVKGFRTGGFWGISLRKGGASEVRAVDGVSLALFPGETLGLVGESGCGKTTLGRVIVRLVEPDEGAILHEERDARRLRGAALKGYRRDVQIVFQNPDSSLNPRKQVGQIIGRRLELFEETSARHRRERIEELLELVRLPHTYADRYPHQLSGGEKQRVGIARAIAVQPKVIVCDEPVTSLDVSVTASILNLLMDLQDRLGVSYLFIAHDLAVVRHISHRVAVMYRGRICEAGPTEAVFRPPFHPYTQALLSAIPTVDLALRDQQRVQLQGTVQSGPPTTRGCIFQSRCPMKIGPICEEETPPLLEAGPGHHIRCHHALETLQSMAEAVPAGESGVAGAGGPGGRWLGQSR